MADESIPEKQESQKKEEGGEEKSNDPKAFVQKAELPPLASSFKGAANLKIAPLMNVDLNVSVVLGETSMSLGDLLKLGSGSVIELNRATGEPIEIFVNDQLFAKGEIVVIEESFGVRISEIVEAQKAEAA